MFGKWGGAILVLTVFGRCLEFAYHNVKLIYNKNNESHKIIVKWKIEIVDSIF